MSSRFSLSLLEELSAKRSSTFTSGDSYDTWSTANTYFSSFSSEAALSERTSSSFFSSCSSSEAALSERTSSSFFISCSSSTATLSEIISSSIFGSCSCSCSFSIYYSTFSYNSVVIYSLELPFSCSVSACYSLESSIGASTMISLSFLLSSRVKSVY